MFQGLTGPIGPPGPAGPNGEKVRCFTFILFDLNDVMSCSAQVFI